MLSETTSLRDKLESNTKYFREQMTAAGFDIKPGIHPIVPVMLYDAKLAQEFAAKMLEEGHLCDWILLPGCTPGESAHQGANIRSARKWNIWTRQSPAFTKVGKGLGVIK